MKIELIEKEWPEVQDHPASLRALRLLEECK